ncbi:signal peptidase complex subunit 3 [Achlya hypogyna]|uniref:Signal peptidase complex subunit 3 n=1 Tax=Achlya hypogyna TaxID=1202772 RepID=A0A1V9Z5D1_ACHHY|nr:signal peptidase complex subunit 3 [Achlya hypogyna]
MHTIWTRANALFTLAMTVMSVMCALTTLTTYLHEPAPVVTTLQLNAVHSLKRYRDRTDKAVLSFDLDADLSSVFNWNTKQLFVYVVAEYTSASNKKNEVVIWDAIVPSKADAILQRKDEGVKYFLADQHDELRNAVVTMKLKWDVMPVCGRLLQYGAGEHTFTMPASYMGKSAK